LRLSPTLLKEIRDKLVGDGFLQKNGQRSYLKSSSFEEKTKKYFQSSSTDLNYTLKAFSLTELKCENEETQTDLRLTQDTLVFSPKYIDKVYMEDRLYSLVQRVPDSLESDTIKKSKRRKVSVTEFISTKAF
jgi:hypothetical protein